MKSGDIAALLVQGFQTQGNGNTDLGWHTGVVQAWDEATGLNSILINGNVFNNLSVLSTGAVTPLQPGDTVAVIRVQSQYFVIGKIRAPGAGAAERVASARVNTKLDIPNGLVFTDLVGSVGPSVSVYIGSARRVLVLHSCNFVVAGTIDINTTAHGYQGVLVSGASSIAPTSPAGAIGNCNWKGCSGTETSSTMSALLTASDGLNQGVNVFSCKYKADVPGGLAIGVESRTLTVIPF